MEGEGAALTAGAFGPVDVFFGFLIDPGFDAGGNGDEFSAEVVDFAFGVFVFGGVAGAFGDFGDAKEFLGESVSDEVGFADPELAGVGGEFAAVFGGAEKAVDCGHGSEDEFNAFALAEQGEEAFAGFGIVEAAEFEADVGFADMDPEGFGSDVFDGMSFVEDDEVTREEEVAVFGKGFLIGGEEGEEEGVVHDHDIGFSDLAAGGLIPTVGAGAAFAGGAGVGFAANHGPDAGGGGEGEVAEGAVAGGLGPLEELGEFGGFEGGEEVAGFGEGAFEAGGAEVVGAAFEENGFEVADEFLDDGDVFVDELLLEIDGVGGDDGFAFGVESAADGGEEVGEGFADAGGGFDDERLLFFQGDADEFGHALLLRAIFEVA